jgi:hypothetical protein
MSAELMFCNVRHCTSCSENETIVRNVRVIARFDSGSMSYEGEPPFICVSLRPAPGQSIDRGCTGAPDINLPAGVFLPATDYGLAEGRPAQGVWEPGPGLPGELSRGRRVPVYSKPYTISGSGARDSGEISPRTLRRGFSTRTRKSCPVPSASCL